MSTKRIDVCATRRKYVYTSHTRTDLFPTVCIPNLYYSGIYHCNVYSIARRRWPLNSRHDGFRSVFFFSHQTRHVIFYTSNPRRSSFFPFQTAASGIYILFSRTTLEILYVRRSWNNNNTHVVYFIMYSSFACYFKFLVTPGACKVSRSPFFDTIYFVIHWDWTDYYPQLVFHVFYIQ